MALPIFPGRLQPSIVGRSELNFCVRDGNRWTLALISTNYCNCVRSNKHYIHFSALCQEKNGDPYRIRTDVKGVRGLCLNHLTNGPFGTPSVGDRKNCRWQVFHCRVPDQSVAPLGSKQLEVLPRVYLYQKRKLSHTVSVWYTFRDSNPGHPD